MIYDMKLIYFTICHVFINKNRICIISSKIEIFFSAKTSRITEITLYIDKDNLNRYLDVRVF